jgi:hypothetical protein
VALPLPAERFWVKEDLVGAAALLLNPDDAASAPAVRDVPANGDCIRVVDGALVGDCIRVVDCARAVDCIRVVDCTCVVGCWRVGDCVRVCVVEACA